VSVYTTKKFKTLLNKWNKKLEKSGFVDHESNYVNAPGIKEHRILSSNTLEPFRHRSLAFVEAKMEYFIMAGSFLNDAEFDSKRDRVIWELHSEGYSIREIVKLFKKRRLRPTSKDTVSSTIAKYAKQMFAKNLVGDDNE
jgi:hypothetical protein